MDTLDPRHFGPKTVRHYIFGTEMSYFFVSVPKCLWDTSALVWDGRQRTWDGTGSEGKGIGGRGGTVTCIKLIRLSTD